MNSIGISATACHRFVSTAVISGSNVPLDTGCPPNACLCRVCDAANPVAMRRATTKFLRSFLQKATRILSLHGLYSIRVQYIRTTRTEPGAKTLSPTRLTPDENLEKQRCPVLFGFNLEGTAKMIYCGQWACPDCAKRLSKKWAVRVKIHIQKDEKTIGVGWWMLTLTLGRGAKDPVEAYKALRKKWDRLRQAINRSGNAGAWQYAAFVEGQPKRQNMPHFHIIMDVQPPAKRNKKGVITKHAIHNWAHKMGFGFEADLKPVTGAGAAGYVAKYVSKGSGVVPKGFRRVRVSHGWQKLKIDPDKRLIVIKANETLMNYIVRVAEETGLDHNTIVGRYFSAKEKLLLENDDRKM